MKKRLGVAVAAMLLGAQIGSPAAAAEPDVEQLALISGYIETGDLEALIQYLTENPELMEGDSVIAVRLREFMNAAENFAAYLAFDPPMRTALARQLFDQGESGSDEIAVAVY
jgi:hypothetical protein